MIDIADPNTDVVKLYYDFKNYILERWPNVPKTFFESNVEYFMIGSCDLSNRQAALPILLIWLKLGFIKKIGVDYSSYEFIK